MVAADAADILEEDERLAVIAVKDFHAAILALELRMIYPMFNSQRKAGP
jgi:hypothetical protein